jgi:tRNA(fMet)-specific endonuclease VapC
MRAFDTDVLVEVFNGTTRLLERLATIPAREQAVPIVVAEEILRARLNAVRQAESRKLPLTLPLAYTLFQRSLVALRGMAFLSYSDEADLVFREWRSQGIRVGTHDLRIAAICVAHRARLVSRNRRDFDRVPGLDVEYWDW